MLKRGRRSRPTEHPLPISCFGSGSLDTTIKVWDAETGALLHDMTGHGSLVGLVQIRGNILVSGNADKTLRVWDLSTGTY